MSLEVHYWFHFIEDKTETQGSKQGAQGAKC